MMLSRSKSKVGKGKKLLINVLYKLGVKPVKLVSWMGVSRATIYRHISR